MSSESPAAGSGVGSILPFQKKSQEYANPTGANAKVMKINLDLTIPNLQKKTPSSSSSSAPKKEEDNNNSDDTNDASTKSLEDSTQMTDRLLSASTPKKRKIIVRSEDDEPQWSMDTLGFFLITKEGEEASSQPYAAKSHKLEGKFTRKLDQKSLSSILKNNNSPTGKNVVKNVTSTGSNKTITADDDENEHGEDDEEVELRNLAEYKCKILGESVAEKITWWKSRARELDSANHKSCNNEETENIHHSSNNTDDPSSKNNNSNKMIVMSHHHHDELTNWRRILLHEIRVRVRRQGISPAERVVAWPLLAGLEYDRSSRLERVMEVLETRTIDSDMRDVMLRDLGRTLPTHSLFRGAGSIGQTRLERVLVCYCALDPEVGYCQGMGFIVAVLLLHMPEADAFGLFVQMMHSRRYQMRGLFQSGFPLLNRMLDLFRHLLRLVLPNLMNHFDDLGIDPAFFASHWFLTLFSYQFSVPVVCRIWDLFLSEGWIWIYRVAIALLIFDEETLLTMTMEDILMHVKLIHEGKSEDEILRLAKDVPIRESDLVSMENEYTNENASSSTHQSASSSLLADEAGVVGDDSSFRHHRRFP